MGIQLGSASGVHALQKNPAIILGGTSLSLFWLTLLSLRI